MTPSEPLVFGEVETHGSADETLPVRSPADVTAFDRRGAPR